MQNYLINRTIGYFFWPESTVIKLLRQRGYYNCEVQALCIVLICMFQGDSCHFPVGRGWEKSLEEKFLFKSKPGTSHTHISPVHIQLVNLVTWLQPVAKEAGKYNFQMSVHMLGLKSMPVEGEEMDLADN